MELVRDIRRNYRLPKGGRTVGEMLAEAGEIRIENHAKVMLGGHLCYGHSRDGDLTR